MRLVEGMPDASVVKTSHGERVQIKDFFRAMEKMTLEGNPEKRDQAKFMFDIGREGISFNGYGELGDVVKKFTNHPDICIVRIKDRLSSMEKTTPCGWSDADRDSQIKIPRWRCPDPQIEIPRS